MPVACRYLDPFPGWDSLQPGDMWASAVELWEKGKEALAWAYPDLARYYWEHNFPKRPPLFVILPNGDPWRIDAMASIGGDGWTVTGEPPLITVDPSINLVGYYHGWLKAGVFTDDPEMRRSS